MIGRQVAESNLMIQQTRPASASVVQHREEPRRCRQDSGRGCGRRRRRSCSSADRRRRAEAVGPEIRDLGPVPASAPGLCLLPRARASSRALQYSGDDSGEHTFNWKSGSEPPTRVQFGNIAGVSSGGVGRHSPKPSRGTNGGPFIDWQSAARRRPPCRRCVGPARARRRASGP